MFLQLGSHLSLGNFLAILDFGELDELVKVSRLGPWVDDRGDLITTDLTEELGIEGLTIEVRRFVAEIRDLSQGPKIVLWFAVTLQAPTHGLGLILIHHIHLVDPAVAGDTGDTAVQVSTMVKVNVVRGLVHLDPMDRLSARLSRLPHPLQLGTVDLDLALPSAVAVRAGLIVRDVGMAAALTKGMAEATVQAELARMHFVRKRDRLRGHVAHACILGREVVGDA